MSLTVKRPTIEGMPSPAARAASTQDGGAAPSMRLDVMRSLRKRPKLALWSGAAVFLLVFVFGLLRRPAYEAQSLIYIEPLASKVLSDGTSGSYDAGRYDSYFQQQMQTALRPDILASAIDALPPFAWRRGGESMQSAVTRLQKSLKVERVLTSYQLSISLVYASPEVNAVTNAYLEEGRKDEHAVIDQRLKLLGEERQRIQQQLGEDRVDQASLGGMLGLGDSSGKTVSPFDAQIVGAETQVAGARQARDVAAAQYAAVSGAGSAALTAAAEEQIATDAGLNSMKQTISQRKALLSTQMAGLTPSNPIYKQDETEIADLDRSLDAMTQQIREKAERRLQDKLRTDLQRTADIEGRMNAELRHQTATATSSVPKLQRAQELNADITRLTARFTFVDDAMRSLELESNGPGLAHLSVSASVPVSPNPSKRKLILALSLPLGCFAGLFVVVLANWLDPKIYSAPDVERVLGFSPIGVLPARSEVTGRTMEEYTLRLAAGLQSAYRTSSAQSFVFTAATATMQTTEFVQGIAQILGTLGFKALVMDASSVLNAANKTQAAGQRGGYRSAALVRTIEGTRQGFAAEELERLKLKYDLLLIDAPPLLTSAETEYLVRCADATILVAESGITVKTELYQSALLLQHLNVAGVGAVLQELHLKDAEPAFRAAIEAVERLQRARVDRLQPVASPEALVAEEPVEEPRLVEPLEHVTFEAEPAPVAATVETVTLPAEAEPLEAPAASVAVEFFAEPAARAEPVHVLEPDPVVEDVDQMRPWKDFLKRTPESVEEPEPEPVVAPVVPGMRETRREQEAEPVIYFQDRMRPRQAEPAVHEVRQPEKIHVERAPMYVEPVAAVRELAPVAAYEADPTLEPAITKHEPVEAVAVMPPAEPQPEPVLHYAPMVEAVTPIKAFERTVVESGTERYDQHLEEFVTDPVTEAMPADEAQPESLMEAYVEKVDELPEGEVKAEETEEAIALEPVMEVAAQVAPAPPVVRREPSPPKMGWFTLKFRGTTERVLRVIPGEEGDEYEPEEEPVVAEAAPNLDAAIGATSVAERHQEPQIFEPVHAEELRLEERVERETAADTVPAVEHDAPFNVVQQIIHAEEDRPASAVSANAFETIKEHEAEALPYAGYTEELEDEPAVDSAAEEVPHPVHHVEEPLVAQLTEEEEPVAYPQPEVEAGPLMDVAPEVVEAHVPETIAEVHTPVKLRWTVRDLHQDELERESIEDQSEVDEPAASPPAFVPATLMSELRSRAAAMPPREETGLKHPSGRRSGAPVEERLEPRAAASLTRRWEMLSRFDATSADRETDVETPKAGS
jgi:uncharacterized protein involved in exopolysaccharide biosynthesis